MMKHTKGKATSTLRIGTHLPQKNCPIQTQNNFLKV